MPDRWTEVFEAYSAEYDTWNDLAELVRTRLEAVLHSAGIHGWVFARAKEPESLTRKVILKDKSLDDVGDKAAARVVVAYEETFEAAEQAIRSAFNVISRESKLDALAYDEVGYLGVHLDTRLKDDDPESPRFGRARFEVQLRTIAQWAWAEVSHEQLYKPAIEVPDELKRRIFRLVAIVEVFDREVTDFLEEVRSLPGYSDAAALPLLADDLRARFGVIAETDRLLSRELIAAIAPLYGRPATEAVEALVRPWLDDHDADVRVQLERLRDSHHPLYGQPELLALLERLDTAPAALSDAWPESIPRIILERLAAMWGREV